jgi:hypothetical protein
MNKSTTVPQPVSSAKLTTNAGSNVSASTSSAGASAVTTSTGVPTFRLPGQATIEHAMKLAINEDRPIMMDYWKDSIEKTVLIGQRDDETKEKILVRSEEEYTSPIKQILKVGTDYIIMTENSIYLVDTAIPFRRISA